MGILIGKPGQRQSEEKDPSMFSIFSSISYAIDENISLYWDFFRMSFVVTLAKRPLSRPQWTPAPRFELMWLQHRLDRRIDTWLHLLASSARNFPFRVDSSSSRTCPTSPLRTSRFKYHTRICHGRILTLPARRKCFSSPSSRIWRSLPLVQSVTPKHRPPSESCRPWQWFRSCCLSSSRTSEDHHQRAKFCDLTALPSAWGQTMPSSAYPGFPQAPWIFLYPVHPQGLKGVLHVHLPQLPQTTTMPSFLLASAITYWLRLARSQLSGKEYLQLLQRPDWRWPQVA